MRVFSVHSCEVVEILKEIHWMTFSSTLIVHIIAILGYVSLQRRRMRTEEREIYGQGLGDVGGAQQ